jgi:hypothetical protein
MRARSFWLAGLGALAALLLAALPLRADQARDLRAFAAISLEGGPGWQERYARLRKHLPDGRYLGACSPVQMGNPHSGGVVWYSGPPARKYWQRCHGPMFEIALFVFASEAEARNFNTPFNMSRRDLWRHVGGPYSIRIFQGHFYPPFFMHKLLDGMAAEIRAAIDLSPPAGPPVTTAPPAPPPDASADKPADTPAAPPPVSTDEPDSEPPLATPETDVETTDQENTARPEGELTPEELATAAGLAGGAALVGALGMMGLTGTRRENIVSAIRDLLRGRAPESAFDAWKQKFEALGWRYSEKNGVATFDPVDGARNEAGEVYDAATGRFLPGEDQRQPAPPVSARSPRDGDVNERGEVWSEWSRGYVGRETYDQDRAQATLLADKARRDLADMTAGPDADIAELHRKIAETRRDGKLIDAYFDARDSLSEALDEQRKREFAQGALGQGRTGLFDDLDRRLDALGTRRDYREASADLMRLADTIGAQSRQGYTPTYTYGDAIRDTVAQTGALALDATVTRGYASSAVGAGIAMRDAARAGATGIGIVTEGAKAAVTDLLFGKATELGAGLAGRALSATRGVAGEAVDAVRGALGAEVRHVRVAGDLAEQARHHLDTLEKGLQLDGSGRMRASLTDVLEIQKQPNHVRLLKEQGSLSTQEAFNHTLRNEVYRPHDQMLLERLRQSHPDLADAKLQVHEIRTPGKTANPLNTDRDFRILRQDAKGDWIEVPKTRWEKQSNDVFGELTFFDPAKCPKDLSPAQQKAWWAEQHGHTPTDRAFREASRDYSDQATSALTGQRIQLGEARVADLKHIASEAAKGNPPPVGGRVTLSDPDGLADMFRSKIGGQVSRGDPFEAIAQAQKGVETLDTVRKAYGAQGIPTGAIPPPLRKAMDLVAESRLPAHADSHALRALESQLGGLGFGGIDDFGQKLASQFGALKWAK